MTELSFIVAFLFAALLFAPSPAAAQNGQVQSADQGSASGSATGSTNGPTQAPITGVFCIEEMTANFCNVVSGPNTGGYGGRSGSASTNGSASTSGSTSGAGTSSIPPCPAEPPFNELCN
jgi:hypothetical protein